MDFARLLQRQCLSILEKAPVPLCIVSRDLTPVYLNPAGARLLLNRSEGVHGQQLPSLATFYMVNVETPYPLDAEMDRAMIAGEPVVIPNLELRREAGNRAITLTVLPLGESDGIPAGAVLLFEDMTSQIESAREVNRLSSRVSALRERIAEGKQRLRTVSKRLLDIQESERRHIARELHDEIGQSLTALKIQLQTLQQRLPDPAMGLPLDPGVQTLDRLMTQVRNLSLELRPSVLDDLGLQAALRWYIDRKRQDSGLDIRLQMDFPEAGFGPDMDMVLFRVVQEGLTNVVRHAGASRVDIQLVTDPPPARLSIQDDGDGFDVEEGKKRAMAGQSLGLIGMLERVNLAGGRLDLSSSPGRGVCIHVTLPLKKSTAAAPPTKDSP